MHGQMFRAEFHITRLQKVSRMTFYYSGLISSKSIEHKFVGRNGFGDISEIRNVSILALNNSPIMWRLISMWRATLSIITSNNQIFCMKHINSHMP